MLMVNYYSNRVLPTLIKKNIYNSVPCQLFRKCTSASRASQKNCNLSHLTHLIFFQINFMRD